MNVLFCSDLNIKWFARHLLSRSSMLLLTNTRRSFIVRIHCTIVDPLIRMILAIVYSSANIIANISSAYFDPMVALSHLRLIVDAIPRWHCVWWSQGGTASGIWFRSQGGTASGIWFRSQGGTLGSKWFRDRIHDEDHVPAVAHFLGQRHAVAHEVPPVHVHLLHVVVAACNVRVRKSIK